MYNCFAGHGGVEMGSVMFAGSPAQCAAACDQDAFCMAFVYMYSQSKCWKRAGINLASCEVGTWGSESAEFSTFVKRGGLPPRQPVAPPVAAPALAGYVAHPYYNCYRGHGGVELGFVSVTQSPAGCATICNRDWTCKGFVFMFSQSKCWKRAAINLQWCEIGFQGQESGEFITFTKD